jgi:signal transduction histidine kinase
MTPKRKPTLSRDEQRKVLSRTLGSISQVLGSTGRLLQLGPPGLNREEVGACRELGAVFDAVRSAIAEVRKVLPPSGPRDRVQDLFVTRRPAQRKARRSKE